MPDIIGKNVTISIERDGEFVPVDDLIAIELPPVRGVQVYDPRNVEDSTWTHAGDTMRYPVGADWAAKPDRIDWPAMIDENVRHAANAPFRGSWGARRFARLDRARGIKRKSKGYRRHVRRRKAAK